MTPEEELREMVHRHLRREKWLTAIYVAVALAVVGGILYEAFHHAL